MQLLWGPSKAQDTAVLANRSGLPVLLLLERPYFISDFYWDRFRTVICCVLDASAKPVTVMSSLY